MSLFRTLIFQNYLFNEYIYSDFDSTFLNSFIASSISHLTAICEVSTIDTADLVSTIIVLLRNLSKHEKILIELNRLQSLRKSAAIKVSKESEIIKEVENRLQNSAMFKNQLDDEVRLHRIARMEKIDDMAIPVRALYDPISQMHHDYKLQS